jgi:hypothetical protein
MISEQVSDSEVTRIAAAGSRYPLFLNPHERLPTLTNKNGRSVGLVCSRTQSMEFSFFIVFNLS